MHFSLAAVVALSGLSIASPLAQVNHRADAVSLLTDLFATVQVYTGAINATLATLTLSSSVLDKTAAIPKVGASLNSITSAITSTAAEIRAITPANATTPEKRSLIDTATPQLAKRQLIAVATLLSLIILEIFATIGAAIAILGLAALLVFLNPLTSALSILILAVQLLLDTVLVAVTLLLNTLLAGLALTVGGL
ncbi:hypothetical protein BCR34DRAFT_606670 [Clohesyomyces aquaticus]|uniref:Hydrophobic surface binding protein A-domain-containing protein n=1 Tax=Clohesyomyces aquaticus TaxID=1231657 RepID=A0A1Y1YMP2_9PLEO|nr:hypothetical protein BCR34DRAFT_606670 [Clohesyomyces aquaticus]